MEHTLKNNWLSFDDAIIKMHRDCRIFGEACTLVLEDGGMIGFRKSSSDLLSQECDCGAHVVYGKEAPKRVHSEWCRSLEERVMIYEFYHKGK